MSIEKKKKTVHINVLRWKDGLGNDFEPLPSRITDRSGQTKMRDVKLTVEDHIIDKLAKL